MRNLISIPFRYYRAYIYPKISNLRGTTRLKHILWGMGQYGVEKYNGEPKSIFERGEWDNLIILDACRHDMYQEVTEKDVEKRVTKASTSEEYVEETFAEGDFSDVVYVTGNGFLTDEMMRKSIGRENVFAAKYEPVKHDWDEDFGHVLPESISRDARSANRLFPDQKKILHFMQPHAPFYGFDFGGKKDSFNQDALKDKSYVQAELGWISEKSIITAYKKNLKFVLDEVNELIEELDGRTVITADHGELLGENGLYGHPRGSNAKALREVPWDVVKDE